MGNIKSGCTPSLKKQGARRSQSSQIKGLQFLLLAVGDRIVRIVFHGRLNLHQAARLVGELKRSPVKAQFIKPKPKT